MLLKLLMFLAKEFAFRPFEKSLPEAGDGGDEVRVSNVAVIFVHSEPQDMEDPAGLETKFVKNVKWIAGKRETKNIVLHSFTRLAKTSATHQFAETFLQNAAARLRKTGYDVTLTPFGWVCEWDLSVYGESLAKVLNLYSCISSDKGGEMAPPFSDECLCQTSQQVAELVRQFFPRTDYQPRKQAL